MMFLGVVGMGVLLAASAVTGALFVTAGMVETELELGLLQKPW